MSIRILRPLVFTIAALIALELGLEYRAEQRGWNELPLLQFFQSRPAAPAADSRFGPREGFPFRSAPTTVAKPPGVVRYWIASASYADDTTISPDRIFPNLLVDELARRGQRAEVLNAGKVGWNTIQSTTSLALGAPVWNPDVAVLYQMSLDINDLSLRHLSTAPRLSGRRRSAPGETVEADWTVRLVESTASYALLKGRVMSRIARARIRSNDLGSEARAEFVARVMSFLETCRATETQPIICTFATSYDRRHPEPLPESVQDFMVYARDLSPDGWLAAIETLNAAIRQVAAEQRVPMIDLAARLGGRSELFRDFVHFNRDGHAAMARALAEGIARADIELTVPASLPTGK